MLAWFHRRGARVAGFLVATLAVATLSTCARKEPIVEPIVTPGKIHIEGNRVVWTTDQASRASVRYGFTRGSFDHMAYPEAASRKDRAFVVQHSVALLDLHPGQRVYFQTMDEQAAASTAFSSIDSFTATTGPTPNLLVSTMIDIGFGDSHLLTFPTTGKRLLIDCGTRVATASVEGYLQTHSITTLDGMLATHVHVDHLGGEVGAAGNDGDGVLASHPPGIFFDSPLKSGYSDSTSAYHEVLRMLASERVPVVVLRRGQTSADVPELRFDPEVRIKVLNSGIPPFYRAFDRGAGDVNNESIVFLFTYGDVRFIIGGDAQFAAESAMLDSFPADLEVEYLKVHHHGGSDANSASWINAVKPRVAFIPTTQLTWSGSVASFISAATQKCQGIGAHVYVCDDVAVLDRSRSSQQQYNVSFVTDGVSYEVRLEPATQPISRKPVVDDCIGHGDSLGKTDAAPVPEAGDAARPVHSDAPALVPAGAH